MKITSPFATQTGTSFGKNGKVKETITQNPTKPAKLLGATITISNSIKKDKARTEEVLAHEVGHGDDARKHPKVYSENSQKNKDENGKTPHDQRPNEIVANNFQKTVAAEKKAAEQKRKEQKKQEKEEKKREKKQPDTNQLLTEMLGRVQ